MRRGHQGDALRRHHPGWHATTMGVSQTATVTESVSQGRASDHGCELRIVRRRTLVSRTRHGREHCCLPHGHPSAKTPAGLVCAAAPYTAPVVSLRATGVDGASPVKGACVPRGQASQLGVGEHGAKEGSSAGQAKACVASTPLVVADAPRIANTSAGCGPPGLRCVGCTSPMRQWAQRRA